MKIKYDPKEYAAFKEAITKFNIDEYRDESFLLGEGLMQIENVCRYLTNELENLSDGISSLSYALLERDKAGVLSSVTAAQELYCEILDDFEHLKKMTVGSMAALNTLVEGVPLTFFKTTGEIERLVAENLKNDGTMSVGYKDGRFALIFSETVDEDGDEYEEPFLIEIIAVGSKEDYNEVDAYVNRALGEPEKIELESFVFSTEKLKNKRR